MKSIARRIHGFTLLELIISMAVFSVLSVMAYAGLQQVINSKGHTEKQGDRLVELQTAFLMIGRDIEQTISRTVRDGYGDPRPAVQGGEFGTELLSLTRAGRTNFLQIPRSNLQRVAYQFDEEKLYRLSWPMLDQDYNQEPEKRLLISNLKRVAFRYLDSNLEWQDQWPAGLGDVKSESLPKAVEIALEFDDMGNIRRLFQLAPGESAVPQTAPKQPTTQTQGGPGSNPNTNQGNQNNSQNNGGGDPNEPGDNQNGNDPQNGDGDNPDNSGEQTTEEGQQ